MKELLLGNAAIACGAIAAGVQLVAGYPGTPSTEVLQTVASRNAGRRIHVEWSDNEKAAMEVAAGACYCGARVMVTMKQVGLNVASDPLMSLTYIGVTAGFVVLVADDPGPISSQTEQDTRHFGEFANLPVLDPSTPEEAYDMAKFAFELSEKIGEPVILRPTTKICHASAEIDVEAAPAPRGVTGFNKDPKYCIFPPLAYRRHLEIEAGQPKLGEYFDTLKYNRLEAGTSRLGIAAGGVTAAIVRDVTRDYGLDVSLLKVGTPFPAPAGLYRRFLEGCDRILVLEELDGVIEDGLWNVAAKSRLTPVINGKTDFFVPTAGELKYDLCADLIFRLLGQPRPAAGGAAPLTDLPARPPVLCAGCPHRASFYAVKKAMRAFPGKKYVSCGDIGCYTLGNAKPLEMTDTCLCMGGGVTIAQGIADIEPDTVAFGFIGDSTFFASGITGVANAVYNRSPVKVIVLDNSTTAMTGHQPHPGIGRTMMGEQSSPISIAAVCRAMGVGFVEECDPMDLAAAVDVVKRAVAYDGVAVIVFRSPCIAVTKPGKTREIRDCIGCKVCVREIGCPAIYLDGGFAKIDPKLCFGCSLCEQICPSKRIHAVQ